MQSSELLILIAEDSEIMRVVLANQLKELGLNCLVASSGIEAVEQALQNKPDLILMDIAMPYMDGFDATRRIRESERVDGGRVPIVAVTGQADRQECLKAGMDDHHQKPMLLNDLRLILEKWLPSAKGGMSIGS